MSDQLDDSIVENTPVKKKIKISKRKSKAIPRKILKSTEVDNTPVLSQLVAEFNRNFTQKSTDSEKPTSSTSDFACENKQKSIRSVEKDLETSHQNPEKNNISEDPSSSTLDFLCKNEPKPMCSEPPTDTVKSCPLTAPIQSPFSKNYHQMYVFYLLDELIKFSPNHFPKNGHIQLVGILKLYAQDFYLISLEQVYWKSTKIKLDLRNLAKMPECDSRTTVFGLLTFDNETPIIVVQFFQPSTVNYNNFKKLMLRLRSTVPLENFEMVEKSEDLDLSLNLQDDLSELRLDDAELGDETLTNFLDEISFEKL